MTDDEPRFYSKTEAAQMLGVSIRSLDRLREEGRIGFRQYGARGKVLFTQRDLDIFVTLTTQQLALFPGEPTKPQPTPAPRKRGRPRKVPAGPSDGVQLRLGPGSDDDALMDEVAIPAEPVTSPGAELDPPAPATPATTVRPPTVALGGRKRPSGLIGSTP